MKQFSKGDFVFIVELDIFIDPKVVQSITFGITPSMLTIDQSGRFSWFDPDSLGCLIVMINAYPINPAMPDRRESRVETLHVLPLPLTKCVESILP